MFILDSNVLSAIKGARPAPKVAAWIAGHPEDALFTTTICQAEILSGLAVMPEGRRRSALETAARAISQTILMAACCLSTQRQRRPTQAFSRLAGVPAAARPRRSIS
jgi:predicted nucleic acid-binding protein